MPSEKNLILNLSCGMDQRTNNEWLDVDPNSTGFQMFSITNQDSFFSKSLTSREGVIDVCGGVVNASGSAAIKIVDTITIPASGIGVTTSLLYSTHDTVGLRQRGLLIVPSGSFNIFSGNISIQGREPSINPTGSEYSLPVEFEMYLYEVDQVAFPASGVGAFQDGFLIRDISTPVNWLGTTKPYPKLSSRYIIDTPILPIPAAISNRQEINFGSYHAEAGQGQVTDFKDISFKFNAPYPCKSYMVYFLQPVLNLTSGNTNRTFQVHQDYINPASNLSDFSPNTLLVDSILSGTNRTIETEVFQNTFLSGQKTWMALDFNSYRNSSINIVDNPTATNGLFSMLNIGTGNNYTHTISAPYQGFNTTVPLNTPNVFIPQNPPVTSTSVEFGQILTIPTTGEITLYGAYFFANTFSGLSYYFNVTGNTTEHYKRDGSTYNPSNYNINYVTTLSEIKSSSGIISSGTYKTTELNPIAWYTGNYTFTNPVNNYINQTNYNLEKIYSLYPNPKTITNILGNRYLFSVKFLNPDNSPITDYSYIDRYTTSFATTSVYANFLMSPFVVGVNDIRYVLWHLRN